MSLPNDAHAITRSTLFPPALIPEFFNKVRGHSSLAKMCNSSPIPFNGAKEFTFTMDNEVDIVAEAGAKSAGGAQVGAVTVVPIKVEYGARISDEFIFASNEVRLDYLRAFMDGWAVKVARGFDIMAMHGVNPRTGSAATGTINNNHLDYVCATSVTYLGSSSTADANIETAAAAVLTAGFQPTGLIAGNTVRAALAAMVDGESRRVYPELAWGGQPESLNGMRSDFNSTVEYNSSLARAYVGDWSCLKWGIAKELPIEVIQYGNPDNDSTAGDLKGHNQVYLRGEAYIGWGFMDANAFASIKASSD